MKVAYWRRNELNVEYTPSHNTITIHYKFFFVSLQAPSNPVTMTAATATTPTMTRTGARRSGRVDNALISRASSCRSSKRTSPATATRTSRPGRRSQLGATSLRLASGWVSKSKTFGFKQLLLIHYFVCMFVCSSVFFFFIFVYIKINTINGSKNIKLLT